MSDDDITKRLKRIHAAINESVEDDMSQLPGRAISFKNVHLFHQDFMGRLIDADLENRVATTIHNVASLLDHVKKWAGKVGADQDKIIEAVRKNQDLCIIRDLWNRDKHGGIARNPWSGCNPKLGKISRYMELVTKPRKGSFTMMSFAADGSPTSSGDGEARAVLSAPVLDENGNSLGDVFEIIDRGVEHWIKVLSDFGLNLSK